MRNSRKMCLVLKCEKAEALIVHKLAVGFATTHKHLCYSTSVVIIGAGE